MYCLSTDVLSSVDGDHALSGLCCLDSGSLAGGTSADDSYVVPLRVGHELKLDVEIT